MYIYIDVTVDIMYYLNITKIHLKIMHAALRSDGFGCAMHLSSEDILRLMR